MMAETNYKISFTTGGLCYREAIAVARLFRQTQNWSVVKSEALAKNLLKARTQSSSIRTTREVIQRVQILTDAQRALLLNGERQEQDQILWLAVCKQYRFVYEFSIEVIREKFLRMDFELCYQDFDSFLNKKAEWDEGLDRITISTRKKLRQVLFRILSEANIISSSKNIEPVMLSISVVNAIAADDSKFFSIFPVSESDIRKYVKP